MSDNKKTKAQLIEELQSLRHQVAELSQLAAGAPASRDECEQVEETLPAALRERQELEAIINRSPAVIILWKNAKGWPIEFVSDNVRQFGYTPQDLTSGRVVYTQMVHPQDVARMSAEIDKYVQEGRTEYTQEYRILTPSGETHWVDDRTYVRRNASGAVTHYQGIIFDITERKQAEAALRESEEKYRTILESIQEGYFEVDIAGNLTFFNDPLCRIVRYPRDELMGMNNREYMDAENAKVVYQAFNGIYRTKRSSQTVNYEIIRKDGTRRSAEVSASLMTDSTGEPIGFRGIMRDVTERKRVEETLERRAMQLQTAAEVSHAAGGILDPDTLTQQAVDLVCERFNLYYAGLFLVDQNGEWAGEPGRWAVLRAGTGEAGQKMLKVGHKLEVGGASMIGWCTAHGQARIALDVGQDAVHFGNPLLPQTRSEMALPLISRGQVIGAMTIQSDRPAAFTADDITALQTMADQLANAIENVRLLEEAKSRLAQLTALQETTKAVASTLELDKLLHLITQQATSLLQGQGGIINLVDWEKREDQVVASSGSATNALGERSSLASNLSGWVSLHNQPIISNQLQHDSRANVGASSWQSAAIAPLAIKDRVMGTLVVLDKQRGKGEFDQADLDLLIAFANQAATAIQNVRLFEDTKVALAETKTLAEALRVSQERFALATKGANDGLWDWDIQGKSLYWSPRLKELLGYADDELQIDFETFNLLMHPDDRAPTGAAIDAHLKDRVPYDVEERLLAKSGAYRWFRARGQAVWDEAGNPLRMVGVTTDITERKQAEAERERLLAEQARRALQLQTAAEVSRAASSILNLDELLPQVVELVRDRFNLYYVGLFLTDETGRWAALRAATGEAGKKMLETGHRLQVGGSSMTGWCIANAQARIALDVGEEATRFENPLLPLTRSEIALPLASRGHVIGAVTIQSARSAAFTQEDIAILQTMADQLANAIENARLFEETRQRAEELTALNELSQSLTTRLNVEEVLDEAYQQISRVLDTTDFYFALYDPTKNEVTFPLEVLDGKVTKSYSTLQADQGFTGYLIRTLKPLLIQESGPEQEAKLGVENIPLRPGQLSVCWLGAPLIVGDRVVGTMAVMSYTDPHAFDEHDRDLLTTIASQVANAIENARLFEQTQARADEFAVLNELGQSLTARLSVEGVLQDVHRGVSRLVDASNFYVSLYAPDKDEVTFPLEFADGKRVEPEGATPANLGLTGYLIRTRAPLLLRDKRPGVEEARLGVENVQFAGRLESKCWLGVPMIIGDQVLGTMVALSYADPYAYDEHDLDLLVAIANQTAIALQNARLFEQAQTRAEEMTALNELSQALATHLNVDQVLHEVYQGVSRLLDTANFYISLYDPERNAVSFPINVSESVIDRNITVMPADRGLTGYIIRNRTSVLIKEDVAGWLAGEGMEHVGEPAQCWLGVPLMIGEQMLGVMAIQSFTIPRAYDEHDRDMLVAIASQTAVALQNARQFEQAQAHARREQILREVMVTVNASQSLVDGLPEIEQYLRKLVPLDTLALTMYTPGEQEYTVFAFQPETGGGQLVPRSTRMPVKGTISGWVITHGQVQLDADLRKEKLFMEDAMLAADGMASRLVVPLKLGDQVVGTLNLTSAQPGVYTQDHVSILQPVTEQMALALERVRLLEETRTALAEVEATQRRYLSEKWESYLAEAAEVPTGYVDGPAGLAPVGEALAPEHAPDSAVLSVPLKLRGEPIGVLEFYSEDATRGWSSEERSFVEALADQAALALENARLLDETQSRAQREQLINEITARIRASMDMETILRTTTEELSRALNLSRARIRLSAGDGDVSEE